MSNKENEVGAPAPKPPNQKRKGEGKEGKKRRKKMIGELDYIVSIIINSGCNLQIEMSCIKII